MIQRIVKRSTFLGRCETSRLISSGAKLDLTRDELEIGLRANHRRTFKCPVLRLEDECSISSARCSRRKRDREAQGQYGSSNSCHLHCVAPKE